MDIGVPLRDLGPVNMQALADAILGLDRAAWLANQQRQ